ncbi:MAG TPA: ABC transporter ATP-binding protein [Thermoanaerobaculia bacterium]|nr:ABC transporter ATP-binding protein [Thermoanaerobaculia bacterium]
MDPNARSVTPFESSIPGNSSPAIITEGLCRRYGRRWALIDVSLTIPRGAAVMIAGRNGSGKSTLLRILATAIRPDRGSGTIDGFDLVADKEDVRKRIALLGHHPNTYEPLSAIQNLEVAARFLGQSVERALLLDVLDQVGLADRADDPVLTFSAGMRKRISLARALLQVEHGSNGTGSVSVVLLDEPYGQLDPQGFRFVDRLVRTFKRREVTVLIATHELERSAALCELGIVLAEGRLVWSGPASDLPAEGGMTAGSDEVE